MVFALASGSEPEIEMDVSRGRRRRGTVSSAPGLSNPDVGFNHVSNGTALDDLDHTAIIAAGVDLGAQLGGSLVFLREAGDDPGFVDRMG